METVKSSQNEETKLNRQESMNNRFARYIDRVRNLEVENKQRLLRETEDRLAEQHDQHSIRIQELREKYEAQLKSNREEIEAVYATKIKVVQSGAEQYKKSLNEALTELKTAQDRIDDSNGKIVILEQINLSLHNRITDLQSALEGERARSTNCLEEIHRLRKEIELRLDEHKETMNAKNALALEISLYDKLLSDAEKPIEHTSPHALALGRKRKHLNRN